MTLAIDGYGTLLKIGDGATPEVFTTIAEVKDITGPDFTTTTKDVTSHDSASAMREFIATLIDCGEVSFDLNFVPTGATHSITTGLLLDWQNKTLRNFEMVWPDVGTTTLSFSAHITKFTPSAPVDGELGASVTLQITGTISIA